ncbi:MAG TPA: PepSY-associated TM helix domain-containing protein, partial [Prolixibacteraceae bacterium]|nr:PepSY-associated TM helix domain-containing protein [Prolixibacteraceae bacterium]
MKKRKRALKIFKKLHKWPAIVIALFAILFAFSGIVMNHRQLFSPVDVSRKLLHHNYRYNNWNLAAARGSEQINQNSILVYGNVGVWQSDGEFENFSDFNQGFPSGIDNRKIYSVKRFKNEIFAGTHMGLFKRPLKNGKWEKVNLNLHKERIADLALKGDTLLVLSRHYLLKTADGINFEKIQLPEPVGYERKTGLFNTFWELHSGELWGLPGKLIVDLLGIVTLFLSVTGLLHFFFPKMIKRRKKKQKPVKPLARATKKNLSLHNVVGYIFVFFLLINTFSGMHLRPPLLIAIANKQVGIIPGTHLDSPNPWFDKLRRIHWDNENGIYIFSTSEGFYFTDEYFTGKLQPVRSQPPVSVMGCNVFEPLKGDNYLVGSFSGLFIWNIQSGAVTNFITGKPYIPPTGMTSPIGADMAAGLVQGNNHAFWFDYNSGAISLTGDIFPEMPAEILQKTPMS